MSTKSLWPEFDIRRAPRSPRTIIDEAGSSLEQKTGGLIQFYRLNVSIEDNNVEAAYSLYCPPLQYHFPFLRAIFAIDPVYPVTIVADKLADVVAKNENELTTSLAKIFNAPTTVDTIQRLMALAEQ